MTRVDPALVLAIGSLSDLSSDTPFVRLSPRGGAASRWGGDIPSEITCLDDEAASSDRSPALPLP